MPTPSHTASILGHLHNIVHSQDVAWSNYYMLRGIADACRESVDFGEYERIVRHLRFALFDALFAAVGTLCDRTKGTSSLPQMAVLLKQGRDPEHRALCAEINALTATPIGSRACKTPTTA